MVVHFKEEDELDGESVGAVFIHDLDNPPDKGGTFEQLDEWMTKADAQELARSKGYAFEED